MRGAAFNWAVRVSCVLGEVQSLPWTHSAGSALGPRRTALARSPRGWRGGGCWKFTQMSCAGILLPRVTPYHRHTRVCPTSNWSDGVVARDHS